MKRIMLVCIMLFAMLVTVNASAALLTLSDPNAAISALPGPYATVNITLNDATHASVTFTGLSTYRLGDGNIADLNVNAGSFTVGSFSWVGGNTHTNIPTSIGSGNVSEFGAFNLVLDSFDGLNSAVNSLTFILTNTSGTWASDLAVLTANSDGYSAAAHIFAANGLTGFAGDGNAPPPVPEPGTMMLLGSGLVGLAGWGRKKFRK